MFTTIIFSDSCVGRCNDAYDSNDPCACNDQCAAYGNCCDDFIPECAAAGMFVMICFVHAKNGAVWLKLVTRLIASCNAIKFYLLCNASRSITDSLGKHMFVFGLITT